VATPKRKRGDTRTGQTGVQREWALPPGVNLRQTLSGFKGLKNNYVSQEVGGG